MHIAAGGDVVVREWTWLAVTAGVMVASDQDLLRGARLTIGRDARRAERASLVESVLGPLQASAGLDLLELTEYAWHDCYQEITPPDDVILDILICSRGDLATMVRAANVALRDWRDLHLWAEAVQTERQ